MVLNPRNVLWQPADNGNSTVNLMLAAASLTRNRDVLASKVETAMVSAATEDPARLAEISTRIQMRLRVPSKTQSVRVVVQTVENGRLGAAELDSKALSAEPDAPAPEKLVSRPSQQEIPRTFPKQ